MAYYSVLDVTPTNEDWIPGYVPIANRLLSKHGGKYLARTTSHEQMEGSENTVALRIIVEWPTKEAAYNFINDPEYVPQLKVRTNGSVSNHFLIEGKDEFA